MTASNYPAHTASTDEHSETTMTTGTISHTIEDDGAPGWRDYLADAVGARLHVVDTPPGRTITNVIKRARPRRRQPGSGLVSAGMVLLGLLDAGLLYVVFDAQDRFIFSVKHQGPAAMIQALTLDVAMIIFSVLGLGLARRGLAANAERACIVVCAVVSAFMNWTASNPASLRSVAVYVSAPVLLALTTDRTISVVRRHVLGLPRVRRHRPPGDNAALYHAQPRRYHRHTFLTPEQFRCCLTYGTHASKITEPGKTGKGQAAAQIPRPNMSQPRLAGPRPSPTPASPPLSLLTVTAGSARVGFRVVDSVHDGEVTGRRAGLRCRRRVGRRGAGDRLAAG